MSLNTQGYEVVKNAISSEMAEFLSNYFLTKREVAKILYRDKWLKYPATIFGDWLDTQVPDTYLHYADIAMETLLSKMLPVVENIVDTKLLPQYSFARIYKKGDELKPHKDRPSCEISTTIFLGGDMWKIYMEGNAVDLKQGDMCVYRGCELEHWRKPFKEDTCVQVFLHYNIKNKALKLYDGRPALGLPLEYRS